MDTLPTPSPLEALGATYRVPVAVLEDLAARRRAGARDEELHSLLRQPGRGGLGAEDARALVDRLSPATGGVEPQDAEAWAQIAGLRGRDSATADCVNVLVDAYEEGDQAEVTFRAMDLMRRVEGLTDSGTHLAVARELLQRLIATGR